MNPNYIFDSNRYQFAQKRSGEIQQWVEALSWFGVFILFFKWGVDHDIFFFHSSVILQIAQSNICSYATLKGKVKKSKVDTCE